MEPLPKERNHGSRKTGRLICENAASSEHLRDKSSFLVSVELSSCVIWALTWVRALTGGWLRT
jgi:hypothetical protein